MSQPDADYQHFFCMSCGTKLKAKAEKAGKELPCPKCAAVLVIPGSPPISSAPAATANTADTSVGTGVGTYGVRETEEKLQQPIAGNVTESYEISKMSAAHGPDAGAEGAAAAYEERTHRGLIQEPSVRPTLPQWPLVRGVLGFFLEPGAIIYWSVLSVMGTLSASLMTAAVVLGSGSVGMNWFFSVITHGLAGVAGLLLVVFSTACCMAILQESAAGNQEIEDWPGFAITEHLMETVFIVNSVVVSAAVAWFLSYPLAGIAILRAFFEIGCFLVLFPIVLLSMLEAGSCLAPVSLPVLASLRRSWRSWLVFLFESLVIAFGLLAYLELLAFMLSHYGAHVTIPIVFVTVAIGVAPAVLLEMIYFRLLGRLAWVCDEDSRRELAEAEEREDAEGTDIRPTPVDDF